jgi:pSer/pThr/pTyr-binding forkhead associated (FHA) protein
VPAFSLTVLKIVFLVLLYFFVYRTVRAVVVDVRGGPRRPARAPAPAAVAPGGGGAGAPRRGKPPRELALMDERGKRGATFKLDGPIQMGRADACHVKLSDTYVSNVHARVFAKDGAWFVEDMGSTNGTYLNQRKVTAPTELRAGDRLRLGKTTMELRG